MLPFSVDQLSENTESRLIRVNNLHFVNPAEWTTGMGASGFNVRAVSDDHPLDTISIRIDRDIETYNAPVPSEPFNVTGLGGQFDASSPYTSGYQILPRYNADISTLTGVKAADFSAQVQISPNPVSDRLLVQTEVAFDRILLFTATGAWIKTLENPSLSEQISTRQLPEGMYFIRFEKDGAVWTSRFVKH
ncbi:MAG: T9SS type A sorting domain-containing protein [Lewinellaceae bacterium]|nr:T9SS type A sorting domain-containing protein [Lewinellaceae bacterium]